MSTSKAVIFSVYTGLGAPLPGVPNTLDVFSTVQLDAGDPLLLGQIVPGTYHGVSNQTFIFEPAIDRVMSTAELLEISNKMLQLETASTSV